MLDWGRYEAATFDCYGTLIDWEAGILGAIKPLLASRGVQAADAEILALYARLEAEKERGEYQPYRRVLEHVAAGIAGHFGLSLGEGERGVLADSIANWEPFPDTVAALERLSRRYRLVICSNIDDDLFEATRRKLRVDFEYVVTARYCRSYKPDPRHFRVALALLGLPADRVVHIAQSLYHDIAPAGAMGLATVWVNRRAGRPGGATPAAPAGTRPDLEVPDLASVAEFTAAD